MKALTLTQPWAGLVASGIKLIENRSRSIIASHDFGKVFAIHASREVDDEIYDRIKMLDKQFGAGHDQARWTFEPTCYVLRDVVALPEPVPCRGNRGFWKLPEDVEQKVQAQL